MAWTVLEAKASRGDVETAISDWETSTAPTSVDQISTFKIGPNRIGITVVYTA